VRRHDWYRIAQPQGWLLPGQNPINPMTTRQLIAALVVGRLLGCADAQIERDSLVLGHRMASQLGIEQGKSITS
jgi:hypothetical protein